MTDEINPDDYITEYHRNFLNDVISPAGFDNIGIMACNIAGIKTSAIVCTVTDDATNELIKIVPIAVFVDKKEIMELLTDVNGERPGHGKDH